MHRATFEKTSKFLEKILVYFSIITVLPCFSGLICKDKLGVPGHHQDSRATSSQPGAVPLYPSKKGRVSWVTTESVSLQFPGHETSL